MKEEKTFYGLRIKSLSKSKKIQWATFGNKEGIDYDHDGIIRIVPKLHEGRFFYRVEIPNFFGSRKAAKEWAERVKFKILDELNHLPNLSKSYYECYVVSKEDREEVEKIRSEMNDMIKNT